MPESLQQCTRKLHLSYYFLGDTMGVKETSHVAALRANNPGWEVRVWGPDESRALIESRYPAMLAKYDGFPYAIQRSDFSRYAILHTHGGVYMDMDYDVLKTLDACIAFMIAHAHASGCNRGTSHGIAFVNETPNTAIVRALSNSFMASQKAGHPFWELVMSLASAKGTGCTRHMQILSGTGPQLIDKAYRTFRSRAAATGAPVHVLPKQHFNPCGQFDTGPNALCASGPHVYAVHRCAGSWNDASARATNTLFRYRYWFAVTMTIVVVGVVLVALTVSKREQRAPRILPLLRAGVGGKM